MVEDTFADESRILKHIDFFAVAFDDGEDSFESAFLKVFDSAAKGGNELVSVFFFGRCKEEAGRVSWMSNDSFLDLVDDQLGLSVGLQRVGTDQFAVAVARARQGSVGVGPISCPGSHSVHGSDARSCGRGRSSTGCVESRLGCHELVELVLENEQNIGQFVDHVVLDTLLEEEIGPDSLVELGEKSNVGMVAFYHLVPVPPTALLKDVFLRGAPDNFLLTEDLMWFELPIDSDDIVVNRP